MKKIKYILKKNKIIILITTIILICAIAIAVGVYAQVTNRSVMKYKKSEETNSYEDLENNFDNIFTNTINKEVTANQSVNYDEIIYCAYNIENEDGNYSIDAKIPLFKIENDVTKQINKEIYDTFANTIKNTFISLRIY